MVSTFIAILIPDALFIIASYLIWRKWKVLSALGMLVGFVVHWIFINISMMGAIYIFPELRHFEGMLPSQETIDGISLIGEIAGYGRYLSAVCFLIFAIQFSKLKSEKN